MTARRRQTRKDILLSLDCGTQSLRALLFDVRGELLDKVKIEYEPYFSRRAGWAEQDPEIFYSSLTAACRRLKEKNPRLFARLAGVGITGQRDSLINVDARGKALRPAIIWLDQRKARPIYTPRGFAALAYRAVGMSEAIRKAQKDGKCNWIRQNEPEIWRKSHKYLQVSAFLNYRLTGRFADSLASQIGHIPFNYKKTRWSQPGELNSLLFPVEKEKLPELATPGSVLGAVSAVAATETGIPAGCPVIACGSDKGCETIGMGVIDESMASLSFGTTATVQTTSRRYYEPLKFMPAYPAPIPGCFNPEVEIFRGYWMITWFKNEFGYQEVLEAEKNGLEPEQMLNRLLARVPPGSLGLMVQPYWGPGLKHSAAKGSILGFGDVHTRAHVYRAVIEGLAYALLDGLHKIERAGGTRVREVAVSGGASQSDEICQISADIFNLPLVRGRTFETAGLGAAIITAVGSGLHDGFPEAIAEMVSSDRIFEPDPTHARLYRKLYKRVYLKIFSSTNRLYKEIREITGYPERA